MQLTPSFPFTISFFLTDHTDSAAYYCRAVVYDSTTGEVLETVNLTESPNNSHLFSKVTQAPGDVSGHGRKITVVATAYTDSGYTTKSTLYQEQSESYIVKAEKATGGGGFIGVDYRAIKDLIDTAIATIPKPEQVNIPAPEKMVMPEMQWDKVLTAIESLKTEISSIPKQLVSLEPVLMTLDSLKISVESIYIPEVDLTPVLEAIDAARNEIAITDNEQKMMLEQHMGKLNEDLPKMIDTHAGNALGRAKFNFNMPFTGSVDGMNPPKPPERPMMDINKLI